MITVEEFPELIEMCTVKEGLDLTVLTFDADRNIQRVKRNFDADENIVPVLSKSGKILDQYIDDFGNLVSQHLPEILEQVPEYEYDYQNVGEPHEVYYNDNDYNSPNGIHHPELDYYLNLNSNTDENIHLDRESQNLVQKTNNGQFEDENVLKTSRIPIEESFILNDMMHTSQKTPSLPNYKVLLPPLTQPTTESLTPTEILDTHTKFKAISSTNVKTDLLNSLAPVKNEPRIQVTAEVNKYKDSYTVDHTPRHSNFSEFLNDPNTFEDIKKTTDNFSKITIQQHAAQHPPLPVKEVETSTSLTSTQNPENFETTKQDILDNKTQTGISVQDTKEFIESIALQTSNLPQNDILHTRANTQGELIVKPKSDFPVISEFQSPQQQTFANPCFFPYQYAYPNPYAVPYKMSSPFEGSQVLKIIPMDTQKAAQYVVNPALYSYIQMPVTQSSPSSFIPSVQQPITNNPIQVSGPGGQYYICNPIPQPTSNIASLPGVEVRRGSENLQEVLENFSEEIKPR